MRGLSGCVITMLLAVSGCSLIAGSSPTAAPELTPAPSATPAPTYEPFPGWDPPRSAAEWLADPVRGAVIGVGYGGPGEADSPPYPAVDNLRLLRDQGVRIVSLQVEYVWNPLPPYEPDEQQIALAGRALDAVRAAGLYAVVSIRNGPGWNALLPGIEEDAVTASLFTDEHARSAYLSMLGDVVGRLGDRPEIIAWEPIVEPAPDRYVFGSEEPPYVQAAALWSALAAEMVSAIRSVDAERPILIEPVNFGSPEAFASLVPVPDDNILYGVHFYDPYAYTHQHDEPFQAYPGEFYFEYYDRAVLSAALEAVDTFQQRYHVPIVVSEWGGIRWLPGMSQYYSDLVGLFEERGWSWAVYAWYDAQWRGGGFEPQYGPERSGDIVRLEDNPLMAPILAVWRRTLEAAPP